MRRRALGNTGLQVSELALGTVELGLDYGFQGSRQYAKPRLGDAVRVVSAALDRGINLIDTAPAYGESESIVGQVLAEILERPYIATKIVLPETGSAAERRKAIAASVERSLRTLGVETLDLLQIHNATPAVLRDEEAVRMLEDARDQGKVRCLGASVYGEEAAHLALGHPSLVTLQIALSILDQQMLASVVPAAAGRCAGVLVRSAFLRGVLTAQVHTLPPELEPLRRGALRALEVAGEPPQRLAALALRFCLSAPGLSSVIVGVRSEEELRANVDAAEQGPLDAAAMARLRECNLEGEPLLNPVNWTGLI